MPRQHGTSARTPHSNLSRRGRALVIPGVAVACTLTLSGCSAEAKRGFLPHGVTQNSNKIIDLWNGSWVAALAIGVLVWGLILWSAIAYRRRRDDAELPVQLRYNVPIEILYTVVPVFMVAVLFFYTARLETEELDTAVKPDLTVNVVAKQWSWDFNYIEPGTYEPGLVLVELTGKPGVAESLPALYLPVNKRVEFVLTSRDVIHSFWVPQFLQKLDVIPGRVNRFQVRPTEIGTFQGKCAELCGAFHSAMLFQVKVVPQAAFDTHMAELKAGGNVGVLGNGLSREKIEPGDQKLLPKGDQ